MQVGVSVLKKKKKSGVDPDETAYFELSHLDLHCLQKYLSQSTGPKGLKLSCPEK